MTGHKIELVWHEGSIPELEEQIKTELLELLDNGLGSAEELWFHTVMIGDSDDPVVLVWGEEGDERFHCQYRKQIPEEQIIDDPEIIEAFKTDDE